MPRAPVSTDVVRTQFDRRALRLGAHDALLREVQARLLERLDVIRLAPRRILDVGCGAGHTRVPLRARYPAADWIGADFSLPQLAIGTADLAPDRLRSLLPARLHGPLAGFVAADAGALPLADASVDLLLSNLMLPWHPTPHTIFPEWKRVLREGGLLLFSCLGPDTLRQVRAAFAAALPQARPLPFADMHDFGDMLLASGFAMPVMDAERLFLTFATPRALLREVGALGGNPRTDRPRALPTSAQVGALLAALEAQRTPDGRLAVEFEIAYGHAWKQPAAVRAAPSGEVRVPLASIGKRPSLPE